MLLVGRDLKGHLFQLPHQSTDATHLADTAQSHVECN